MAAWLAADQLDFHGAWAVASGWLARAHRLLDPLEPGPDHGWLAFHEGYLAHASGDTDATRELAVAAELGRRFGVPDLEMLGLALDGAALVACAQVEEGMRSLDEATTAALEGDATIPISSAWACCFLVSACTAVLDFERAFAWSDRIAEFAERYGSRYLFAFCRADYGAVHLWRGRWADAEAELEAAVEEYSRSRPAWTASPLLELAELRRRQGRQEEASLLLDRVGALDGAQLCRARLALDRGEPLRAVELLERVLRRLPVERRLDRFPALVLLVRARIARGELDEFGARRAAGSRLPRPHRARLAFADLADGMLAATLGGTIAPEGGSRTPSTDSRPAARHSRQPRGGSSSRRAWSPWAAPRRLSRRRPRRLAPCACWAPARRRDGPAGSSRAPPTAAASPSRRSPRERDVLRLLAEGLTNRQIAERLVVSEHTVHRHVTNILRKLDLPSRTAAAARAVRSGLLDA